MLLRAKTKDLLQTKPLNEKQEANSQNNMAELGAGKTVLTSYPRRLVLELTNNCNLRCVMCGRDEADFVSTTLQLEQIRQFQELFEHIEEVTLFGWGEPTVHPEFAKILEYLDEYPVRKYFVTNGMRLDVLKDALFNYHVDIVAISLDGATAETNNRIRRGADFNRIVANLRAVVAERNKRGTSLPYMNFVFAAMKSNLLELPALIELAADIGIEEVKAVYLTVFSETLRHESLINEQELVRRIFDEATRKADQLGVKLKLPYIQGEDVGGELPHKPCYVAWRDFFFGSDGFVRPCQSTPMKFFSIDTHAQFVDMWNSKELQEFRSRVNDQITMTEECRRCYQSSHANWNQDHAFLQIANTFAPEWK